MLKKIFKYTLILVLLLGCIYLIGPKVEIPELSSESPQINLNLQQIDSLVKKENLNDSIRKGNQSRLIWADSISAKTEYAVVYLHGFSASPAENEVIYTNFANRYGTNAYAPRLYEHGLNTSEPLLNFTAGGYLNSAKKALSIGKKLGEKIILICTSTGATAGLYLAATNPEIEGLILYSPNIDIYDPKSSLLTKPWGKQILKIIMGGNYQTWQPPNGAEKYWYGKYRIEAIPQLKALIQATMNTETFKKIKQPLFMGYYYKNEEEQDKTVSVKRMLEMFDEINTPKPQKVKEAFPNAKNHSLASKFFNPDYLKVQEATFDFAEKILHLKPIKSND